MGFYEKLLKKCLKRAKKGLKYSENKIEKPRGKKLSGRGEEVRYMDMRKFTEKSVTALQDAQSVAKEYGNQEIGQVHLFYALITADEGLIPQLLKKMELDLDALSSAVQSEIARCVKVSGGEQYISSALAEALDAAEKQATKMGDSYVSVEHLFFGLT